MEFIPSVWVVTHPAQYEARLFIVKNPPGSLDQTDVVLRADLLDTLISRMPKGRRRVPRFPVQAATVIENWL